MSPENNLEITSVERNKEQHLYIKNMLTMGITIEKKASKPSKESTKST